MPLDSKSPIPLHIQLKEILRQEILQGNFKDRIPSERELMDRFGVSRSTVREAISALVLEGIIEKKQGRGTFICRRPVEEWLGMITTYNEIIQAMGLRPGTKLLLQERSSSPPEIAAILGVEEFYVIERLRYADDIPIAIEKQYYPLPIGLELSRYDLNEAALYDLLEGELSIRLWRAEQIITAVKPATEEVELLKLPEGVHVLLIERITYDPDDNVVEYLRGVFRSDMYAFRIKLSRRHCQ